MGTARVDVLIVTSQKEELDAVLSQVDEGGRGWGTPREHSGAPYHVRTLVGSQGQSIMVAANAASPQSGDIHKDGDPRHIQGIVLVDEIDLQLHPSLQRVLVPRFREAMPQVQWIVTTHSPLVLASFDRQEIKMLDSSEPGGVRQLDRDIIGFPTDQTMHGRVCVFCRSELRRGDRGDVEHFRPKSHCSWLAYSFENYFLSCSVCNRISKREHFPLLPGAPRLHYYQRQHLAEEQRLLLDPAVDPVEQWLVVDPNLVFWQAAPTLAKDSPGYLKAEVEPMYERL